MKSYSTIDYLFTVIDFLLIIAAALIAITGMVFAAYPGLSIDKLSVIIGLLSALLLFGSYERIKQRLGAENKISALGSDFKELKNDYLKIPSYELIEGKENITLHTLKEIKKATYRIRSTNFKNTPDSEDTPSDYYQILANQITNNRNTLEYICCFNEGTSISERKKGFDSSKLTVAEYAKMSYYGFKEQHYFNFLIIDESVLFMGFPISKGDRHMQVALKITIEKNEMARTFIKDLIFWYDNILITKGRFVETKTFLGIS